LGLIYAKTAKTEAQAKVTANRQEERERDGKLEKEIERDRASAPTGQNHKMHYYAK